MYALDLRIPKWEFGAEGEDPRIILARYDHLAHRRFAAEVALMRRAAGLDDESGVGEFRRVMAAASSPGGRGSGG